MTEVIKVGTGTACVAFSNWQPFGLIAGPCVIESEEHAIFIAKELQRFARCLRIQVFIR